MSCVRFHIAAYNRNVIHRQLDQGFLKICDWIQMIFFISLLSLHYTKEINRYTCQHFILLIGSFIHFGFVLSMSMRKQLLITYGLSNDLNIYLSLLSGCDVSYIAYFVGNCSNGVQ